MIFFFSEAIRLCASTLFGFYQASLKEMTFSGFRFLKEKACLKVRERAKKKRLKQSKFLVTLPTDYTHGPWKMKRAHHQGESLFSQVWKSNHFNFQGDRLSIRDKLTKF